MNIEFVQPYLEAARDVMGHETKALVTSGKVALRKTFTLSSEVAVMIGITGQMEGVVLLTMPKSTALSIANHMTGDSYTELDELVQSAIAELANVISGQASIRLSTSGYDTCVSPPAVIVSSAESSVSTLAIPAYSIPLTSACGELELQVALKENS